MAGGGWFKLLDAFLVVDAPKVVRIRNRKLGIILRTLQLSMFLYILIDFFIYEKSYFQLESPEGYATFWAEEGARKDVLDVVPSYCDSAKQFKYKYDDSGWQIDGVNCKGFTIDEIIEKGENEMFFMTFVEERDVRVSDCASMEYGTDGHPTSSTCLGDMKKQGGLRCSCTVQENYYPYSPEEMSLVFALYFSTSVMRKEAVVASTTTDNADMPVVFLFARDGTIDRENPLNEARGSSLSLSIKDLLKAGGAGIDDENKGVSANIAGGQATYPGFRLTGMLVRVTFEYTNIQAKLRDGANAYECHIHVIANQGWHSKGSSVQYSKYPRGMGSDAEYIDLYRYGIKFQFFTTGTIGYFNFSEFVKNLAAGFVLMGIASSLVWFITFNTMGKASKMFKEGKVDEVGLEDGYKRMLCHGFQAAVAFAAFGGEESRSKGVESSEARFKLPVDKMINLLRDVAMDHKLKENELVDFLCYANEVMDPNQTGNVEFSKFLGIVQDPPPLWMNFEDLMNRYREDVDWTNLEAMALSVHKGNENKHRGAVRASLRDMVTEKAQNKVSPV